MAGRSAQPLLGQEMLDDLRSRGAPHAVVGAGGMVAANYAYNRSPRDGSVIIGINRAVPTQPLFGTKGAKYDATRFNWLGSLNNSVSVCVSWKTQKVKTLEDVFKMQLITGAQNASDMVTFPIMMNNLFGTRFKVIGGYASGTRVNLALERGEVQGRCGWSWASVKATRGHWINDGSINFIVQVALKRHKDLPNLPLITDMVKNKRDMQAVELILTRQEYGRPYMAPPGVPKARVEALRKAFMDTTRDAGFIKDIEKQRLELNPKSGWDMQKQIEKIYATPKDVVAYAVEIQKKGVKKIKQIKTVYVKHTGKVVLIKRKGHDVLRRRINFFDLLRLVLGVGQGDPWPLDQ